MVKFLKVSVNNNLKNFENKLFVADPPTDRPSDRLDDQPTDDRQIQRNIPLSLKGI